MPKTFFQSVIFTTIMATFMVFIMGCYNTLLNSHGTLFFVGFKSFFAEFFCALPLALLFAARIAPVLAQKILGKKANSKTMRFVIPFFIVSIMVPSMSAFALLREIGADNISLQMYIKTIGYNFIVAYLVQILFLGKLVQNIFKRIIEFAFKHNLSQKFFVINSFLNNPTTIIITKIMLIISAITTCIISF